MASSKLVIRKGMFLIQGKVRACCSVQAFVAPEIRTVLDEHFLSEPLFKRSAYSAAWPSNAIEIPAALAPHVSALMKNDACPEITIKTILAGQLHQAANVWEMMSFEFITKLAFENLRAIVQSVGEMGTDVIYLGENAPLGMTTDLDQFAADTVAEVRVLSETDLAA